MRLAPPLCSSCSASTMADPATEEEPIGGVAAESEQDQQLLFDEGTDDGGASTDQAGGASTTTTPKKGLGMSSKFTAELGLLESLNKLQAQREERQKEYARKNPGLSLLATADRATLKSFRVVPGAAAERAAATEQQAVLALPHKDPTVHPRRSEGGGSPDFASGAPLASDQPSRRLARLAQTRRERHEQAVAKFEADRADIAARIKQRVELLSAELKHELAGVANAMDAVFLHLGAGDQLAAHPLAEVRRGWELLEVECRRHRAVVEAFGQELSTVEGERASAVRERVGQLALELVTIAHELPDAVERFVERATEPVNRVVLRNAKA